MLDALRRRPPGHVADGLRPADLRGRRERRGGPPLRDPGPGLLLVVYTVSGALAGLGGVVMASQLKSGAPTYGLMYELYVIAAVVVGGTSLSGGEGKILGTLIGALHHRGHPERHEPDQCRKLHPEGGPRTGHSRRGSPGPCETPRTGGGPGSGGKDGPGHDGIAVAEVDGRGNGKHRPAERTAGSRERSVRRQAATRHPAS